MGCAATVPARARLRAVVCTHPYALRRWLHFLAWIVVTLVLLFSAFFYSLHKFDLSEKGIWFEVTDVRTL